MFNENKSKLELHRQGFTLVELLLVIGIIATLAVVVFVALDPAKRFADSRDARRTSDVETILSAIHQYIIDNKGSFPSGIITDEERMLGGSNGGCVNSSGGCNSGNEACINLLSELSPYLKNIPFDPLNGSESNTQYTVVKDGNGIITVKACSAEGGVISVSR